MSEKKKNWKNNVISRTTFYGQKKNVYKKHFHRILLYLLEQHCHGVHTNKKILVRNVLDPFVLLPVKLRFFLNHSLLKSLESILSHLTN